MSQVFNSDVRHPTTVPDYNKEGDLVDLGRHQYYVRQADTVRHDHKKPSRCPGCGHNGWVYRGWFACDGGRDCRGVAREDTGEFYLPNKKKVLKSAGSGYL